MAAKKLVFKSGAVPLLSNISGSTGKVAISLPIVNSNITARAQLQMTAQLSGAPLETDTTVANRDQFKDQCKLYGASDEQVNGLPIKKLRELLKKLQEGQAGGQQ